MIIDGSKGGGQVLRTALAMSLLTNMPFKIKDIRINRPNPGLKQQHFTALNLIQEIYDVNLSKYEIGTKELTFIPKNTRLKTKRIKCDIQTAGSITLLLQSILPALMFADAKLIVIDIKGGTDVAFSMPFDFLKYVFLPQINYLTKDMKLKLIKRGFYPKGSGEINLRIKPDHINNHDDFNDFHKEMLEKELEFNYVEQGKIQNITGISLATLDLQKREVAERQARSARLLLKNHARANIRIEYCDSLSTGSSVVLFAKYSTGNFVDISKKHPIILGADALGKQKVSAEEVGKSAANDMIKLIKSEAVVDEYSADNIIPFLVIVGGKIKTNKITDHIVANVYVVNEFLKALKSEYFINIDSIHNTISLEKKKNEK